MIRALLLLSALLLFTSCSDTITPYLLKDNREELRTLIESVQTAETAEAKFITNQRIISFYQNANATSQSAGATNQGANATRQSAGVTRQNSDATREEVLYLTSYVENQPDDPFDAYYLLIVAEHYRSIGALPFARYYYERIVKNHPDLLLDGSQSVHRICLTNLIELVDEPEIRVGYYKELISRFQDEIDRGRTSYELAKTYEELGEWDLAMQFFKEYLNYPDTVIPGQPDARTETENLVTLYDLPQKPWTFEKLDDLIVAIQRAIWSQNPRYLNDLRSKVGFFARAWEDDKESNSEISLVSDLSIYLKSRIRIPGTLDHDSNDKEAYLPTYGWGFRIPTWYLYFRRLDFPADPSIHNDWEWAGIYLGEKPY